MTTPPPGWHPDPDNPHLVRWWDGHRWTEHTHQATNSAPPLPAAGHPESQQPQETNSRNWKTTAAKVVGGIVVVYLVLVACDRFVFGPDRDESAASAATSSSTAPVAEVEVPPYEIASDDDDLIIAHVHLGSDDALGLRRIHVNLMQRIMREKPDGGYFIYYDCATPNPDGSVNRIGTGKVAVGRLGAAQTGLEINGNELRPNSGRVCEPA